MKTILTVSLIVASSQSINIPLDTSIKEMPMVMAHDAATTYLEEGLLHPVNQWTKTQPSGGMKGLLDCSTRSFDWRAILKDGKLIMHHGPVDVDHSMEDSIDEILTWLDEHDETPENLVHMTIADCSGTNCMDAVTKLLESKNVTLIEDCSEISGKTVGDIMKMSSLNGQKGSFFVTNGCVDSNYDPSVACSGFGSKRRLRGGASDNTNSNINTTTTTNIDLSLTYTCYADSSTKDFPLNRMWDYVKKVVETTIPTEGNPLYSLQALWEETDSSIAIGEAHLSSLLDDEKRSQLNSLLTQRIKSGEIDSSKLNLVEINNVCDGGNELISALYGARGWN